MEMVFGLISMGLSMVFGIGFLIGMVKPDKVIPWNHTTGKERTIVAKIYLGGLFTSFAMIISTVLDNFFITIILFLGWIFAINSIRRSDLAKTVENQTVVVKSSFELNKESTEKKSNLSFFERRKKIIIAGILIVSVFGFSNYSASKAKKDAEQRYSYSCEAIKNNDLNKALNYVEKYESDSDKLLKNEIKQFQDDDFFIQTLRNLSDEEFDKIKNGKSNKAFFSNKELNNLLIEKISNEPDKYSKVKKYDEELAIKWAQELKKVELAQRKKSLESQFHPWDGSHIGLEQVLKRSLKDPDSYQHIETRYTDNGGDTIKVYLKYRAKNSFGGYVVNVAVADVTVDGQILSVDW